VLDDYSGLFQGAKVLSNQEKIGKVRLIQQNDDGKWLITLNIYLKYQEITNDMLFKIENSSLIVDFDAMEAREKKEEEQRLAKIKAEEEVRVAAEEERLAKIKAEEEARVAAEEVKRLERLEKQKAEREARTVKEEDRIENIRYNIRHFYFYAGTHNHAFKNPTFKDNLGSLLDIEIPFTYGFTGNTYNRFPFNFKYDINYSKTPYNLLGEISFDTMDDIAFDLDEDGKIVFDQYDHVDFSLTNINSSISFDLLPKFFIRPFIGVGYSYNTLEFHASTTDHPNSDELNFHREQTFGNLFIVSNLIYEWKGLQHVPSGFSGNVYFDLSYRFSLIEKELKWDDIQFNIGFGI